MIAEVSVVRDEQVSYFSVVMITVGGAGCYHYNSICGGVLAKGAFS